MNVLVLKASLKHAGATMDLFCDKLNVFFDKRCNIDSKVENSVTFDPGTLRNYDAIVFAYTLTTGSIPSTLLEFFDRIEGVRTKDLNIYTMAFCEEYEPKVCQHSNEVVAFWAQRHGYHYRGSFNIGSYFVITRSPALFVVTNYLQMFSNIVKNGQECNQEVSALTKKSFLSQGNRYWKKQIRKERHKNR